MRAYVCQAAWRLPLDASPKTPREYSIKILAAGADYDDALAVWTDGSTHAIPSLTVAEAKAQGAGHSIDAKKFAGTRDGGGRVEVKMRSHKGKSGQMIRQVAVKEDSRQLVQIDCAYFESQDHAIEFMNGLAKGYAECKLDLAAMVRLKHGQIQAWKSSTQPGAVAPTVAPPALAPAVAPAPLAPAVRPRIPPPPMSMLELAEIRLRSE